MSALRWLIRKDLLRFVADRNGAALTVGVPVVLAALLSVLFAPRDRAADIEVLVVDEDGTERSQQLVQRIDEDGALRVESVTLAEARERLENGDASVALVLPPGTGEAMSASSLFGSERPVARILYDPSRAIEVQVTTGLVTKITMQEVGRMLSDPAGLKDLFQGMRQSMAEEEPGSLWVPLFDKAIGLAVTELEAMESEEPSAEGEDDGFGLRPPIELQTEKVTGAGPGAGYNTYAHNFAGMLCMFLLFWGADAAKELVAEREEGSLTRVRLSPVTTTQILLGRGVSTVLVSLLMSLVVYLVAIGVFGVQVLGSSAGFALVIVAQAVFVGGFAILLAGLGRTARQIANLATFAILIMSFLGGAWMPSFLFPEWLQGAARLLPTWWATDGLAAMTWRGLDLSRALLPAGVLLAYGVACAAIGARTYRPD